MTSINKIQLYINETVDILEPYECMSSQNHRNFEQTKRYINTTHIRKRPIQQRMILWWKIYFVNIILNSFGHNIPIFHIKKLLQFTRSKWKIPYSSSYTVQQNSIWTKFTKFVYGQYGVKSENENFTSLFTLRTNIFK